MNKFNRLIAIFLTMLSFLSLLACAPNLVVSAVTPTPEVTTAPTPTLTPEPTEVPTPTLDEFGFSEERKAELNQQIKEFLSFQGEFILEKLSAMMMETISPLILNEVKLGIVNTEPQIQGYFFDHFEKENRILLVMGFDGKDGSRFVTLVDIPSSYPVEELNEPIFLFRKYKVNNIMGIDYTNNNIDENGDTVVSSEGNIERISSYSKNDIVAQLNDLKDKVIVLSLNIDVRDRAEITDVYAAYDWLLDYFDEVNSKIGLSFGLFQLVPSNDIPYDGIREEGDSSLINKINDITDISDIDTSKLPIIFSVGYFSGDLNIN